MVTVSCEETNPKFQLRKLGDRSASNFLCKDIHLKGTVETILREIHQVIFEKKLKVHLSQKLHLEWLRKPLPHFWARNPLSSI